MTGENATDQKRKEAETQATLCLLTTMGRIRREYDLSPAQLFGIIEIVRHVVLSCATTMVGKATGGSVL